MANETLKAIIESACKENDKILAEMTEDQKKAYALKLVPKLAVGAQSLGGVIYKAVDEGTITDKDTKDLAGFVGGLACCVQQFLGYDDKEALREFSEMFGSTQVLRRICEGEKE